MIPRVPIPALADQTKTPVAPIPIPADQIQIQVVLTVVQHLIPQMVGVAPVEWVRGMGQAVTDLEGVDRVEVVQVEEVTQLGEAAQEDRAPVAGDREAISLKK